MIKVTNLHKYYNKGQNNEIHAVDDTSTTASPRPVLSAFWDRRAAEDDALNIIGGLDKPSKGTVAFKDKEMRGYRSRPWDLIRSRHFGYVFKTTISFPNSRFIRILSLSSKIFDLPREEIDRRIELRLDRGRDVQIPETQTLSAFRRPATTGGDRPRARKKPGSRRRRRADRKSRRAEQDADYEHHQKISAECLVVLVTHERLAEFTATNYRTQGRKDYRHPRERAAAS